MKKIKPKVIKNNVSYFVAGFKASMFAVSDFSPEKINELFYKTVIYPNVVLNNFLNYEHFEDDEAGTEYMLSKNNIKHEQHRNNKPKSKRKSLR